VADEPPKWAACEVEKHQAVIARCRRDQLVVGVKGHALDVVLMAAEHGLEPHVRDRP
jgi:hypothetical protein